MKVQIYANERYPVFEVSKATKQKYAVEMPDELVKAFAKVTAEFDEIHVKIKPYYDELDILEVAGMKKENAKRLIQELGPDVVKGVLAAEQS